MFAQRAVRDAVVWGSSLGVRGKKKKKGRGGGGWFLQLKCALFKCSVA